MKGRKLILFFLLVAMFVAIAGYFGIRYLKDKQVMTQMEEYIPQEEITEEQMRKTMVSLNFYNNEIGDLDTEARLINTVDLIENPYGKLVQMLIDGPKSDKLKSLIPEGVILNGTEIIDGCVTVDVSIEILNHTEDQDLKEKMIKSIVNTLTELTEVDSVKILIDGETNEIFGDEYVRN